MTGLMCGMMQLAVERGHPPGTPLASIEGIPVPPIVAPGWINMAGEEFARIRRIHMKDLESQSAPKPEPKQQTTNQPQAPRS